MTLLLLLLALAVVAGVAAVAAGMITGGLDDPATTVPVHTLPSGPVGPREVAELRFAPALRGYRMEQVDAALDRLGLELQRLREQVAELEAAVPTAPEDARVEDTRAEDGAPAGEDLA